MNQEKVNNLYIFDMGNVTITEIYVLDKCAKQLKIDYNQLELDYMHYVFPLMEGMLSDYDYWKHVSKVFNVKVEGDPLADNFKPKNNLPVIDMILKLKQLGHRVVCGTNTNAEHYDILKEMGIFNYFHKVYASHLMGVSKPSMAFYKYIIDCEKFCPEKTFFIDDMEENVSAAKTIGINAFRYDGNNKEVETFLFNN